MGFEYLELMQETMETPQFAQCERNGVDQGVHNVLVRTKQKGIVKVEFGEGDVFELNNGMPHMVHNTGSSDRIHLIVDWAEGARESLQKLRPGQVCKYGREIQC